jgi:hypothetical protein
VVVSPQIESSSLTLAVRIATGIPSGFRRHRKDLLLWSFVAIQGYRPRRPRVTSSDSTPLLVFCAVWSVSDQNMLWSSTLEGIAFTLLTRTLLFCECRVNGPGLCHLLALRLIFIGGTFLRLVHVVVLGVGFSLGLQKFAGTEPR